MVSSIPEEAAGLPEAGAPEAAAPEEDPIRKAIIEEINKIKDQTTKLENELAATATTPSLVTHPPITIPDTTITPEAISEEQNQLENIQAAGTGFKNKLKQKRKTFYKKYRSNISMKRKNKTNKK